ncbi:hypothetical protein CBS11350_228 [Aspergillus niger]|nr:hypothetical protein CBS11350_228 [Aspergillus niger]
MLQDLDRDVNTEEELTGEPAAWRHVYMVMRCPGSCELGPHCWQDPYGKKHYKLYRDELLSLVRYVKSGKRLETHEDVPGMIREQIYRAERRRLEGAKSRSRLPSESAYPPITITNVLPAHATQPGMSSSPPAPEDASTCSTKASRLKIAGFRDANVQAYCDWQQSQVANESWKDEFRKACDVALGDGLDLDQIEELSDPEYFKNRGVKWGIARRFVRDIRYWVDNFYCYSWFLLQAFQHGFKHRWGDTARAADAIPGGSDIAKRPQVLTDICYSLLATTSGKGDFSSRRRPVLDHMLNLLELWSFQICRHLRYISQTNDHNTKDFWQMAYEALTESDPNSIAVLFPLTGTKSQDTGNARTREKLDEVVEATKAQYKEKQGKDSIRATADKILNSVLSFQDVVDNIVKFDPTGYASSAWAIVSLGLTMAKNHADLRGALFSSSEYLADLLTRCAFIEEQYYGDGDPNIVNAEKKRSIIRVYVAILRYCTEVRRVQQSNKGRDIMVSITAITSQPLTQLKTSIKEEESHLHQWLVLDQHLRRKKEAEDILNHLDQLTGDLQKVRDAVDMLNLPFAKGAFFGSFEDQHEDECLAGTRTELLRQVQDWGRSSDKCIFWLSGMAGTGKSTITRTVARMFKEDDMLGASFFFKRGEGDRGSAVKFFPTIVKQLAVHIPQMVPGIRKAIEDDPAIPGSSLRDQFNKLILQPLLTVDHGKVMKSTVIVIDALDECEPEEDMEIILDLLPEVETATNMAIRFFLTSRPEIPIRCGFDEIDKSKYQNTILQDLDEDVIKHDIALYLREEFSKIQQKRRHALPPGWPGEEKIEAIAMIARPLFIFAATVCRFVADRHFDPDQRLREFSGSTGSKMDSTYRPVLNQLLVQDATDRYKLIKEFQRIIGVIILLANPLSLSSLAELLLGTSKHDSTFDLERQISIHLNLFHSVLSIPSDPKLPIRTLHLSFHDYLVDDRTKDQEATAQFWLLASGSDDKIIKLWDAATGIFKYILEGYSGLVYLVVFSNNGQLLASSSRDKIIKLWDAATDAFKYILEGYSDPVYSVAFLNNGQLLASGLYDKTIKLWDAATSTLKYILEDYSN